MQPKEQAEKETTEKETSKKMVMPQILHPTSSPMPSGAGGNAAKALGRSADPPSPLRSKGRSHGYDVEGAQGEDWKFSAESDRLSFNDFPPDVCKALLTALQLREDNLALPQKQPEDASVELGACPESVLDAMLFVRKIAESPKTEGFCRTRLEILEAKFNIYKH